MKQVELYARVRHAVLIEGISERAAAERFGINARRVFHRLLDPATSCRPMNGPQWGSRLNRADNAMRLPNRHRPDTMKRETPTRLAVTCATVVRMPYVRRERVV